MTRRGPNNMNQTGSAAKVTIIGLDGATWNVIDDVVLDHAMPTLKKLRDNGYWGVLKSTEPALTPAAWTSCITGCSPPIHGVAGFRNYRFKNDTLGIGSASDCLVPNMFQKLGDQDFSVAAINVPWTYPCTNINGIMVAGYGSPGIFTYPEQFRKELLAEISDYDILAKWETSESYSLAELDTRISLVERSFIQRLQAATLISKRTSCDVMMLVFQDLDKLGHYMWQYLDSDKRNRWPGHRDRMFKMFSHLDSVIAGLLKLGNDSSLVAVVSDHGMGPKLVNVYPNLLLYQWGYLKFQNPLRRFIRRTRRNLWSLFGRNKPRMSVEMKFPIDWARSKAVLMLADINGHLFLNVRGRQPKGTIEPGVQYENTLDDLQKRFSQLRSPLTGLPLFEKVVRPSELYSRDCVDNERFGDLVLVPGPGCFIKTKLSAKIPGAEPLPEDSSQGCHRPEGIFILSGPNIKPARAEANIIDIAPTVYASLGAKLPKYMDGRVLTKAFNQQPRIEYLDTDDDSFHIAPPRGQLTADEEQIVAKRLAELGYLG